MDFAPWDMKYCLQYIVVMHIYNGKQGKHDGVLKF